jgi:hypothetical protein
MEKLFEEVEYLRGQYTDESVQLYEGLSYNTRDIIKQADFYSLSRYLSGMTDDLGRDKQFYNVVNFRVTVAKTATEFDIKDFVASSDETSAWVQTMLFNRECYKWMKESRFAVFLNKFAYTRPKYGGVLYKKIEQEGELKIEVCDWRNLLTDQVNVLGSPIIELHYLSPLDIYDKRDVWNNTGDAMALFDEKRKKKDEAVSRLEVMEVTGIMSENVWRASQGMKETEKGDSIFFLQKHFILNDENTQIVFYSTKPKELGYRYLAWEEVAGRGLGRGVIEESEEGQTWVNDAIIKQKNTMDIAGKVLIKTDADNVASNILEVDDGKIFKLEPGRDMTAMQLAPAAIGQYQNMVEMWNVQMDKATSTFDANTGEQPPSGTPYSQTALLNQVAQRPFAFRQEEAAIELDEMFNEWVVPYIIKRIKKSHMLVTDFDEAELAIIDESIGNKVKREVAKQATMKALDDALMTGNSNPVPFTQDDLDMVGGQVQENMRAQGAKRYVKIPDNFFDGWQGKMTLNINNEQQNKANVLNSLSSLLQTVSASYNPQTGTFAILENPTLSKIFGTIVDTAGIGISPVELGIGAPQKPQPAPAQPTPMPQTQQEQPVM